MARLMVRRARFRLVLVLGAERSVVDGADGARDTPPASGETSGVAAGRAFGVLSDILATIYPCAFRPEPESFSI